MSTSSKFQRLRASSKTKKNNTTICLEITPHKIQKPHPTAQRENPRRKKKKKIMKKIITPLNYPNYIEDQI